MAKKPAPVRYRSSVSGKIITKEQADKNKRESEKEVIKPAKRKP